MSEVTPTTVAANFRECAATEGLDPPCAFAACINDNLCIWYTVNNSTIDVAQIFGPPDHDGSRNLRKFNPRFMCLVRWTTPEDV